MTDLSILFQNVSFTYDRVTQSLIHDLSVHFTLGWTGIVGANGVGKSTILKLATGGLEPQQGRVIIPDFAIYCPQRTDNVPDHLSDLILSIDEPTNHLDLPSIGCLEQALMGCPCGLLLVSHDQRFLKALTHKRWQISEDSRNKGKFILETQ